VTRIEDDDTDPIGDSDMERRCYLSSKRLFWFFGNQFYELARRIEKGGLTSSSLLLPPRIICQEEVGNSLKEAKWHFIPTIEVPSPLA
jgi:hypothetical protein